MQRATIIRLAAIALVIILALTGCEQQSNKALEGTAENNILTFSPNLDNKPIVRIGMQHYAPNSNLTDVLNRKFPDYLFVIDQSASAGTGAEKTIYRQLKNGTPYDLIISGFISSIEDIKSTYLVDLSAESFLDGYLLSALQRVSTDGHIYLIPAMSTLSGIAYNADMFRERGWTAPSNTDEFFALCEEIRASGVTPFSACFKYGVAINTVLGMMCYAELYKSPQDAVWLERLMVGQAAYKGHMEPFYELAKRFYDTGVIPPDYFTASLTKQRQQFWAGEVAMINYDSMIYSYAQAENADFEIGFMPFPAKDSENSGFMITPEYYISVPKLVEQSPERFKLVKEVLAYFSSNEGQKELLRDSLQISSVKGVTLPETPATKYAQQAYDKGNLYPVVSYEHARVRIEDMQKASVQAIFEGASVEEAINMMDESMAKAFSEGVIEEEFAVIAKAEEAFTTLETSYYIADKLKQASNADIGLMINGGYFRSNLAMIEKGDITNDLSRFTMKGVGVNDFLTTYKLTGAQIARLLERPVINGVEIDAYVAASGLKIEYAPWNERGARVLKVSLADGSELADDQLFTVAAWSGVIDAEYISETVKTHEELGELNDILLKALSSDGSIRPDIKDRVKLVWPQAK